MWKLGQILSGSDLLPFDPITFLPNSESSLPCSRWNTWVLIWFQISLPPPLSQWTLGTLCSRRCPTENVSCHSTLCFFVHRASSPIWLAPMHPSRPISSFSRGKPSWAPLALSLFICYHGTYCKEWILSFYLFVVLYHEEVLWVRKLYLVRHLFINSFNRHGFNISYPWRRVGASNRVGNKTNKVPVLAGKCRE